MKATHILKAGKTYVMWKFCNNDYHSVRNFLGKEELMIEKLGFKYNEFVKRFKLCSNDDSYEDPRNAYFNLDVLADVDAINLTAEVEQEDIQKLIRDLYMIIAMIYGRTGQPFEIKTNVKVRLRL